MNSETWEHLYIAFTGPVILMVVAYAFKFYADYTERKERRVSTEP